MNQREKAIITAYTGISMMQGEELEELYKYIDELFGRPVYTHEFYILADEIKKRSRDDFIALCRKTDPEIVKCKDCILDGVCTCERSLGKNGFCNQGQRKEDED